MDWGSLELQASSFVDEQLHGREADLLFRVGCAGRSAFLYVLFEHQSTSDAFMPFRLLRYMTRIWDAFLLAHPEAATILQGVRWVIVDEVHALACRPACPIGCARISA